jgi:5-methylcytosine-specific restriction protein A
MPWKPPAHQPQRQKANIARPSASSKGYGVRWRAYRRWYLKRHPLCVDCQARGVLRAAAHIDHIKPVSGPNDPGFWNEANHQALCHSCHSRKTVIEDGGFGRGKS